jgi:hypothetical protein
LKKHLNFLHNAPVLFKNEIKTVSFREPVKLDVKTNEIKDFNLSQILQRSPPLQPKERERNLQGMAK